MRDGLGICSFGEFIRQGAIQAIGSGEGLGIGWEAVEFEVHFGVQVGRLDESLQAFAETIVILLGLGRAHFYSVLKSTCRSYLGESF